jgi:four helix bundle suffix protein
MMDRYGQHGRNGQEGLDGPAVRNQQSMTSISSITSIYAATAANAALVLIGVAITLLGRQVQAQAAAFEQNGGFTERLYRVRQQRRRVP